MTISPTTGSNNSGPAGRGSRAAQAAGVPHTLARVGSMLTLFFNPGRSPIGTSPRCDTERFGRYFWGLIERGVYMPCSQYEALFISAAHSEAEIDNHRRGGRSAGATIGCYALSRFSSAAARRKYWGTRSNTFARRPAA